jgi:hypothetical protein
LFAEGPSTLAVYGLSGLTADAVPANKELVLAGESTVAASLNLSDAATAGKLTVKKGAKLTASTGITITGTAADANIVVEGTLAFATNATALNIAGKVDLSKATVDASAAGVATLALPNDAEIAAIKVGDTNDLVISGATGLAIGSITSDGGGVKSASVTKYSVAGTDKADYVGLATAAVALSITKLDGKTFEIADIGTLGSLLTIGGAAKLKGDIGTTAAYFPLTTENLAKLVEGSEITYTGEVTGAAEKLVIPAGVAVATGSSATLALITGLEVNGTLTVDAPALTAIDAKDDIAGTGTLTAGAVLTGKAVLIIESDLARASLGTTTITADDGLEIPAGKFRTFTGVAAPSGNVTVNGSLTVATTGSLTVAADKALTAGYIKLGPGTWTATGAATTIAESVITLGNNVSATFGGAGATVLTGTGAETNTFTALGGTVTLGQSTNKLTITGTAATAKLATGNTAGIAVNAGLDITTATVDISGAVTSVIKLAAGDAVGIKLANADSVILLDSSQTFETSGHKAIDGLTVDTGVKVFAESDAGDKDVGKFVGATTANTIVASGGDAFSLTKGIKTKS